MRDLLRNQQVIYYALRNVSQNTDEWGNTVDVKGYSSPARLCIDVSANKGNVTTQAFGTELTYDREMVTHKTDCPIDEYTHLWLDGRETTDTHNYEVVAVSKSLNCIRYAIKRVNVS